MTKELQKQIEKYNRMFLMLDKYYPRGVAFTKKQDIRKIVYKGKDDVKKEAMEIVWCDVYDL